MALRNTEIWVLLLSVLVRSESWLFERSVSHWNALRISVGYSEAQLHILLACRSESDPDDYARISTPAEFNKKDSQVSLFLGNYQQQASTKQAHCSL